MLHAAKIIKETGHGCHAMPCHQIKTPSIRRNKFFQWQMLLSDLMCTCFVRVSLYVHWEKVVCIEKVKLSRCSAATRVAKYPCHITHYALSATRSDVFAAAAVTTAAIVANTFAAAEKLFGFLQCSAFVGPFHQPPSHHARINSFRRMDSLTLTLCPLISFTLHANTHMNFMDSMWDGLCVCRYTPLVGISSRISMHHSKFYIAHHILLIPVWYAGTDISIGKPKQNSITQPVCVCVQFLGK